MFPPSFHDLIDIPVHVPKDKSTKKDLSNRSPIITKGYASTNVNGQNKRKVQSTDKSNPPKRIKQPQRTRLRPPPKYKPAIRRTTKYTTTPRTTTVSYFPPPTTTIRKINPTMRRRKPTYYEIGKRPDINQVVSSTIKPHFQIPLRPPEISTTKAPPTTSTTASQKRYNSFGVQNVNLHKFDLEQDKTNVPKRIKIESGFRQKDFNVGLEQENIGYFFGDEKVKEPKKPSFTTIRPPFRPSKIDPFADSFNSYFPTTYKPDFFSFNNQFHTIKSNNFGEYPQYEAAPDEVIYQNQRTLFPVSPRENIFHTVEEPDWSKHSTSPFTRHPFVDKQTFQKINPFTRASAGSEFYDTNIDEQGYLDVPFYYYQDELIPYSQKTTQKSYLETFLQPPPQIAPPQIDRHSHEPQYGFARSNSHSRLPSILSHFGFFPKSRQVNRRSGTSSPNINSILNDNVKQNNEKGYLLTQGPLPNNAQRVHVFGPFKNPPIGAPIVRPHQSPVIGDSVFPTEPSTILIPPSQFDLPPSNSPALKDESRPPSFKVIHLPKESGGIETNEIVSTILSPGEFTSDLKESFPIKRSSDIKESKGINAAHMHNKLSQVTEHDKQRIIAAKFHFPKVDAVRRSGYQRHVIPVPVPLLTSSGNQVSKFHTVVLPPFPHHQQQLPYQRQSHRRKDSVHPYNKPLLNPTIKNPVETPNVKAIAQSTNKNIKFSEQIIPQPRFLSVEEPQSYQEPRVTGLTYGGWKVVDRSGSRNTPIANHVKGDATKIQTTKLINIEDDEHDLLETS